MKEEFTEYELKLKNLEQTIRNYKTLIHDEKKKLLNKQTSIPLSILIDLINIIINRQNNMYERAQHLFKRHIL